MGFLYIVESTRFTKLLYEVIGVMSWKGFNPLVPRELKSNTQTYICRTWVNGICKNVLVQLSARHTTYRSDQFSELKQMGLL